MRYGGKADMGHMLTAIGVKEAALEIPTAGSLAWGHYLDGLRGTLYDQYRRSGGLKP